MDEKLRAENEALKDLFQHPGWAVLMRTTQERIENFRAGFPFNVDDEKALYFAKGMMGTLKTLIDLPETLSLAELAEQQGQDWED